MSHITCQEERDENAAILNCRDNSGRWATVYNSITDEYEKEWVESSSCVFEKLSYKQDRCKTCKKVFTY